MTRKILIADDDALILMNCFRLEEKLSGFEIETAMTPSEVESKVLTSNYALVFLDISFTPTGKEGISLLENLLPRCPNTSFIMMSTHQSKAIMGECLRLGAIDYYVKGEATYKSLVTRITEKLASQENDLKIKEMGASIAKDVGAVFASDAMAKVFSEVAKAKNETNLHVLITGPTGAGKEVIASAISRKTQGKPYFPLNSGCIGKDLFESELFGHEKGAFTGADRRKIGLLEKAKGGDIFLDELARLSLDHQAKLLRAVQSGEFYRTGGTELLHSNARIIAATNEDLQGMANEGLFREDLLHRLNQFLIKIPPLTARKDDIPVLINHFISQSDKPDLKISPDCLEILQEYRWPGNVRELQNTVSKIILNTRGKEATIGDLPRSIFEIEKSIKPEKTRNFRHEVVQGTRLNIAVDSFIAAYIRDIASNIDAPTIDKVAGVLSLSSSSTGRYVKKYGIDLGSEFRGIQAR